MKMYKIANEVEEVRPPSLGSIKEIAFEQIKSGDLMGAIVEFKKNAPLATSSHWMFDKLFQEAHLKAQSNDAQAVIDFINMFTD